MKRVGSLFMIWVSLICMLLLPLAVIGTASITDDTMQSQLTTEDDFIALLTESTWSYLHSDWATDDHLPWSWRSETLSGGDYANPTEIGFYALSWLMAYDLQESWSPTWEETDTEITAILTQLRAWQTGTQEEQTNGPNAYQNSVFYQWYWITGVPTETIPIVGEVGTIDHLIPSVDNAWLAASLITIRAFSENHGHTELAQLADAILDDMDFTLWYNEVEHKFYWGDIEQPSGGATANTYSDENRIINFIARALGQISAEEYKLSLDALDQYPGTYDSITVDKISWDGSYFTYAGPALFIQEMDTDYGVDTITQAVNAQVAYADFEGYEGWGLSDCYDVNDGAYIQQGSPPAATPEELETNPGLISPHASAMALITPLASDALSNLQTISDTFPCAYDSQYGFRDSVMANPASAQYGQCSNRFTSLAQEWVFLSLANYQSASIWRYFYLDTGVRFAHADMVNQYMSLLPQVSKAEPPPQTMLVADFDIGEPISVNNLSGDMGAAYIVPNHLEVTYPTQMDHGNTARLEYAMDDNGWVAFWLDLVHADLSDYNKIVFDIRSDEPPWPNGYLKVELKRFGNTEVEIAYVDGLLSDWQTFEMTFDDFYPLDAPGVQKITDWSDVHQLVFTFEENRVGDDGIVFLDNIYFEE